MDDGFSPLPGNDAELLDFVRGSIVLKPVLADGRTPRCHHVPALLPGSCLDRGHHAHACRSVPVGTAATAYADGLSATVIRRADLGHG